ncbi:hypothetical protein BKA65DRAFT_557203 [Rhexocercosporidium sp. MPI-PUGE-AT-0058]|nr:hypothetical protein BKA65DRAFT_557203 [Rhexocercosporidium sp. MPI-PUGE-AT-0058]
MFLDIIIYNFIAFVGMLFTYFPEKQIVIEKESKMQTLKKIGWLGAVFTLNWNHIATLLRFTLEDIHIHGSLAMSTTVALSLSIRVNGGSIGYTIYFNNFGEKLKKALLIYVTGAVVGAGLPKLDVMAFVGTFLTDPMSIMSAPRATPASIAAATRGSQHAYSHAIEICLVYFDCF